MEQTKRRFQLIRAFVPADFITLGNAASGTGSVLLCLNYLDLGREEWLIWAMVLIPIAFVCDALDGHVARWRQRKSPYGGDLDSLADVISFGVAPAVIGFTLGLRGVWDTLVLLYFVCCGISRLARFNVTAEALTTDKGKVSHFEGTPIPTSILIVGILAILFGMDRVHDALPGGSFRIAGGTFHPLSLLYAISGSLMISTIRIPKP